jgi:hypothetical protein
MSSSEHSTTLFRNVRVFDGRSPVLSNGSNVLVRGSTIESISTQSIDPGHSEHRVEIDGGGRVLMPGLIDAHWHAMLASMPIAAMMTADIGYLNLIATGHPHAAPRIHHRARRRGAIVRAQAGHRRRNCCGGTVTLIGMSSRPVSFGSAAMDQLWGVDISGGSVERGNLTPDREAIGHHLSVVGRRQQVPTDPEMWRNAAERRQEPLGMSG